MDERCCFIFTGVLAYPSVSITYVCCLSGSTIDIYYARDSNQLTLPYGDGEKLVIELFHHRQWAAEKPLDEFIVGCVHAIFERSLTTKQLTHFRLPAWRQLKRLALPADVSQLLAQAEPVKLVAGRLLRSTTTLTATAS